MSQSLWYSDLPAQWAEGRVCDHAVVLNGYPFDSSLFNVSLGLPLVRIRDITNINTEVRYSGERVEEAVIRTGDILIGMDGDFNVAHWRGGEALLNQRVCCVRPMPTIDGRFITYILPVPLRIINDLTHSK